MKWHRNGFLIEETSGYYMGLLYCGFGCYYGYPIIWVPLGTLQLIRLSAKQLGKPPQIPREYASVSVIKTGKFINHVGVGIN